MDNAKISIWVQSLIKKIFKTMRLYAAIILGLCLICPACKSFDTSLSPNQIDFTDVNNSKILSESDRKEQGHPFIWRCYHIQDVKPTFRTWRDADPLGASNVIVTMCDLKISASKKSVLIEYSDTRGREISYCNEFMAAWEKLTANETDICISGRQLGSATEWIWNKFKTQRGCYGFWDGYAC
jgi:hypothetical protein